MATVCVQDSSAMYDLKGLPRAPRTMVIALDKSGSMGRSFDSVRQAVGLIEDAMLPTDSVQYLLYDSECSQATVAEIMEATSGGGTNFADVWQMFVHLVKPNQNADFIFMTDGQDNSNWSIEQMSLAFVPKLTTLASLTVSTIGFGAGTDLMLLEQMRTAVVPSAIDGSHFQCDSAAELSRVISGLFAARAEERAVRVCYPDGSIAVANNVSDTSARAILYMHKCPSPHAGTIMINDVEYAVTEDASASTRLALHVLQSRVALGEFKTQSAIDAVDRDIVAPNCQKYAIARRLRCDLDAWRDLLATHSATELADHETFQKLLRDVRFTSASKHRKATKMRMKGSALITAANARVRPILPACLATIAASPVSGWTCPLSLNTVLETHAEGDIVGIGIHLELPENKEAIVMAPESARVTACSANLLYSYKAWADMVQYADGEGKEHSEPVFRDANGQLPTAFLPLSFTDEHFERCLEPVLPFILAASWIGDPLAIDHRQKLALASIYGQLVLDSHRFVGTDVQQHVLPALNRVVQLGCMNALLAYSGNVTKQTVINNFKNTAGGRVPATLPSVTAILALDPSLLALVRRERARRITSHAIRRDASLQKRLLAECFPNLEVTTAERELVTERAKTSKLRFAPIAYPEFKFDTPSTVPPLLVSAGCQNDVDIATCVLYYSHKSYARVSDADSFEALLAPSLVKRKLIFDNITAAVYARQEELQLAMECASNIEIFAAHVPNRSGTLFTMIVELLGKGKGSMEVFEAILAHDVHFDHPWVKCPLEVLAAFQRRLGSSSAWHDFQDTRMIGTFTRGHVYRSPDKPNRHGHCRSNPNPLLTSTVTFNGF